MEYNKKTILEIQEDLWETYIKCGWDTYNRSPELEVLLIKSELYEILEGLRKNESYLYIVENNKEEIFIDNNKNILRDVNFIKKEVKIKGIYIEFIDLVIRLLNSYKKNEIIFDNFVSVRINMGNLYRNKDKYNDIFCLLMKLDELLNEYKNLLLNNVNRGCLEFRLITNNIMVLIWNYFKENKINIRDLLYLKNEYNKTRGFLHNKKF